MRVAPASLVALAAASIALAGCAGAGDGSDPQAADFEELGLQADESTGILRGVVVDEAIRPLAGVLVTAAGPGGGNVSMTTADDGLFGFDGLAPGTYFITVVKAGYVAQQASGDVVAGEAEPKALKVLMAADPSTAPYVQALHMDGYITCSVRPMILAQQCGFGQSNDVVNADYPFDKVPAWVQSEMVWDSTQAVGDELSLSIRCLSGTDNDPAEKCPEGQRTIARSEGKSPQIARINATLIEEWALGVNPLHISLFAFGRSDLDVYDEETVDGAQQPVTGKPCLDWSGVLFPAGTCVRMTGPGVILNQKVDVFSHFFYGFAPVEGWTFGLDGDPLAPPA